MYMSSDAVDFAGPVSALKYTYNKTKGTRFARMDSTFRFEKMTAKQWQYDH